MTEPDCWYCRGKDGGLIPIGCPWDVVDRTTWDILDAADTLGNNGGWPNGIGWANEPAALVDAVNLVRSETAKIKAELAKKK